MPAVDHRELFDKMLKMMRTQSAVSLDRYLGHTDHSASWILSARNESRHSHRSHPGRFLAETTTMTMTRALPRRLLHLAAWEEVKVLEEAEVEVEEAEEEAEPTLLNV
jgi:hypothetical protein